MRIPPVKKYRSHGTEYSRVHVNGKWVHLGRWRSDKADQKYQAIVRQLINESPPSDNVTLMVKELILRYIEWAHRKPLGQGQI